MSSSREASLESYNWSSKHMTLSYTLYLPSTNCNKVSALKVARRDVKTEWSKIKRRFSTKLVHNKYKNVITKHNQSSVCPSYKQRNVAVWVVMLRPMDATGDRLTCLNNSSLSAGSISCVKHDFNILLAKLRSSWGFVSMFSADIKKGVKK